MTYNNVRNYCKFIIVLSSESLLFCVSCSVDISDDRPSSYLGGLDTAISLNPNFILCCVSNNKADRYAAIKKKCYVDKAIPTQVIVKKNMVSKGMMSIATKVAIQINCKLGGAPWTVELPLKVSCITIFLFCFLFLKYVIRILYLSI